MQNSLNNKNTVFNFKKVIDDVIDANLNNRGLVKYISAVVINVNDNNTVNVYIPPDNHNKVTGLINKCGEILEPGDSVELCAKNGFIKNSWVAVKHGKSVSGSVSDNFPVGSIISYGGFELPNNWLVCDGSEVSRTTYAELFANIGTNYGEGDGETTFNLPNMKGRIGVGLDSTQTEFDILGKIGGSKFLQAHTHTMARGNDNNLGTGPTQYGWQSTDDKTGAYATNSTGAGDSQNLQPYSVVNYIIKASSSYSYVDISKAHVINNLTNTSISDALSANMGKELNEEITHLKSYSTDEQVIGEWIDGRPLYRKCYSTTIKDTGTGYMLISTGVSDIDVMLSMRGTQRASSGNYHIPLVFYNTQYNYIFYNHSSNNFEVRGNWDPTSIYIIAEYVKK